MAYGDVKRQVEALLFTVPAGLTTQQIYERANATTAGDQALIRATLRKLARSHSVLRVPIRPEHGRGGATFRYFPKSPEGRQNFAAFQTSETAASTIRTVSPNRGMGRGSGKRYNTRQRILECLAQAPSGLTSNEIEKRAGIPYDVFRSMLSTLVKEGNILRARTGAAGSSDKYGRGGVPYRYFPKTTEGRTAMRELQAATGQRRTAAPSTLNLTRSQQVGGGFTPTPTFGRTVEALVRITLPDGTHDVPFNEARKLKDELAEVFG